MYMNVCLYECVCHMCISGVCRGQKKVSFSLEVVLQMFVSQHAGAGKLGPLLEQKVL